MSKLYHENKEEQMNKKIHGMEPLQHENAPYSKSGSGEMEHVLKNEALHHGSIQLLAYQIHCQKGGAALDNWLEAERILMHHQHD